MKITIINGPNLNLLGKREPAIYGHMSFEEYLPQLQAAFPELQLAYFQSNHEGAIIDHLHAIGFNENGIVLNAGALSHTSYAIADAISAITTPVWEVHISDTHAREAFRHIDVLSDRCAGLIMGQGLDGYRMAIEALLKLQV